MGFPYNNLVSKHWILGPLERECIAPPRGRPAVDIPGGEGLYAAVGAALWSEEVGLIARVGEDFPQTWLDELQQRGWGVQVRRIPQTATRRVLVYGPDFRPLPPSAEAFLRHGGDLPAGMLDDHTGPVQPAILQEPLPTTLRPEDLPIPEEQIRAAYFAPADWWTHALLPEHLRQHGTSIIALTPDEGYLLPEMLPRLPTLLRGLTAFLPRESALRRLLGRQTEDLWAMAEAIAAWGVAFVVIQRGGKGYALYDALSGRRWEVPAYPVTLRDPTGMAAAFGGGFTVALHRTLDPLEATLHGAVSASVVGERIGALAALDVLPGLPQARLTHLRERVHRI